jgi:DNA (cytosine-5)-methyltransferase 1
MSLTCVELFAGCGGSSEGLKEAGVDVRVAVERDRHAVTTYRANSDAEVIDRDIETVSADELREAADADEIDIVSGSPPCQAFSMAGNRELVEDRRGRGLLFEEYLRLVRDLFPRACIAENVEGLTNGAAEVTLKAVLRELVAAGYRASATVLRAQWHGVPQTRNRVFIIAFRDDLSLDPRAWFPAPRPTETTIGDALPHVLRVVRVGRPLTRSPHWRAEQSWAASRPGPTLTAGGLGNASRESVRVETRDGEFRRPNTKELLAYSGFRPDFHIDGSLAKQWERLGNSVPPPMMRAVAEKVVAALGG